MVMPHGWQNNDYLAAHFILNSTQKVKFTTKRAFFLVSTWRSWYDIKKKLSFKNKRDSWWCSADKKVLIYFLAQGSRKEERLVSWCFSTKIWFTLKILQKICTQIAKMSNTFIGRIKRCSINRPTTDGRRFITTLHHTVLYMVLGSRVPSFIGWKGSTLL